VSWRAWTALLVRQSIKSARRVRREMYDPPNAGLCKSKTCGALKEMNFDWLCRAHVALLVRQSRRCILPNQSCLALCLDGRYATRQTLADAIKYGTAGRMALITTFTVTVRPRRTAICIAMRAVICIYLPT
jgi:hypothetical protein